MREHGGSVMKFALVAAATRWNYRAHGIKGGSDYSEMLQ